MGRQFVWTKTQIIAAEFPYSTKPRVLQARITLKFEGLPRKCMLLGLADRARKRLEPLWSMLPDKAGISFDWAQIRALAQRDPSIIIGTMLALNLLRLISSL